MLWKGLRDHFMVLEIVIKKAFSLNWTVNADIESKQWRIENPINPF